MKKRNVRILFLSAIVILVLALGATAIFAQTIQDPDPLPEVEDDSNDRPPFHSWGRRGFGNPGFARGADPHAEQLAEELGVSVEDLENAFAAAVEAAREDGILGFPRRHERFTESEFNSYLEDALSEIGVTLEDLNAAQEAVREAMMADLLEQGLITQDQIDLAEARQAVKEYVDHRVIMEQAAASLGIDIPDPEELLEGNVDSWNLMDQLEEKGLTMQDLSDAVQAAFEKAIETAVSDGVIDSDQAALILETHQDGFHSFGGPRAGHGFHGGGMRGFGPSRGQGFMPGFGGFRENCPQHGTTAPTGLSL